jgi:anti-sigma factor RsiW
MNCYEATPLIAAHVDGETDWRQTRAVERHLAGCADCAARREALLALRAQLHREIPYYGAPPALRERLRERFANEAPAAPRGSRWLGERSRWFAGGALAGAVAAWLAWTAGTVLVASHATDEFAREVVGLHVRATLGDHLMQVASSDQHTVKPWLSARLDYSPPVPDMAADGYTLVGGRIDYLDRRPIATLVYRVRDHNIDVFVCPSRTRLAPSDIRAVRGFNVAHAKSAEMDWLAVSDVNAAELTEFVQRLALDAGPR